MKTKKILFLKILLGLSGLFITAYVSIVILPAPSKSPAWYGDNYHGSIFEHINIWPFILFIVMILGMLFNQFFEILQKRKAKGEETVNLMQLFKSGITGISFWMAIFVSPFIFYATYLAVASIPEDKIALFYAFQNGFFWYYIFNKIELKQKAA